MLEAEAESTLAAEVMHWVVELEKSDRAPAIEVGGVVGKQFSAMAEALMRAIGVMSFILS